MDDHTQQILSWFAHVASAGAIVTTLAGLLPPVGAGVAIIWYLINIHQSVPVQRWLHSRRAHKIAKLKSQLAALETLNAAEPETPAD